MIQTINTTLIDLGCFISLSQLHAIIGHNDHIDFYLDDLKAIDFFVPAAIFDAIKKKNAHVLAKRALVQ